MSNPADNNFISGFPDDSPYIEENIATAGTGTVGTDPTDLDALLNNLLADGIDGEDDPDTAFSINAAASFAALVEPEQQITELHLQEISLETAQTITELLTPFEL